MKEVAEKAIEAPQPGKAAEVPAPDPLQPKTEAAPSPQNPVRAAAQVGPDFPALPNIINGRSCETRHDFEQNQLQLRNTFMSCLFNL